MRTAALSRHRAARLLATLAVLMVPLLSGGQAPPGDAGPTRQLAAGAPLGSDQAVLREGDHRPVPRVLPDRRDVPGQSGRDLGGQARLLAAVVAVLALGPMARVRAPARRPGRARPATPAAPRAPPCLQPA